MNKDIQDKLTRRISNSLMKNSGLFIDRLYIDLEPFISKQIEEAYKKGYSDGGIEQLTQSNNL